MLKKKEERALFKNRISAATESQKEEGEIEAAKKKTRSWTGGEEEWIRTHCHVRHFPNLPGGEITNEGILIVNDRSIQEKRKVQG